MNWSERLDLQIINKNKLWNGLPAVFYTDKYLVFSPYNKQLVLLKEEQLSDSELFEVMKKNGFFGVPLEKPATDRLTIMLYLTDACNLKCIYCFDDSCPLKGLVNKKVVMSPENAISQIRMILENFNQFIPLVKEKKLTIHFFGGEPTLGMNTIKKIVEFLEVEKIDAEYRISTNGVTKEENVLYMIKKNFLFDVAFDGPPEVHDKQRPSKAGFKSSVFTERMVQLIKQNNGRVRIKVVVTRDSVSQLVDIVEYIVGKGVTHIRLEPVLIDGRAQDALSVDIDEFVKEFFRAEQKAKELSKQLNKRIWVSNKVSRDLFNPSLFSCQFIEGNVIILSPGGIISKCVRNIHSDPKSPFVIGKIQDGNLLLNKHKLQTLTGLLVNKMNKCQNCFAKYICSGDCINENYEATGQLTEPKERNCEINKKMIHNLIIRLYEETN